MIASTLLRRLTAPADPDSFLAALDPRWGTRLRGVVESVTPLTSSAATLTIRPGRRWAGHVPGQFVTLGVEVDGVMHHRCYSLSAPPRTLGGRQLLEVTVQAVEGGTVSTHLVRHTRPGDVVLLSPAEGNFTLERSESTSLLFLTGGSGITPVMAMLRSLAEQARPAPTLDVVLVHHAAEPERCLFLDELYHLARSNEWLRLTIEFTRVGDGAPRVGEALDRQCPDWRDREVFTCGPESMRDAVLAHWGAAGLLDRVHVESFVPARSAPTSTHDAAVESVVRFARSDRDVLADPTTSLLELAEDAGLTPPSGCRMGICHTCSTRLLDGCVRDLRDGRRHEAGGHIQLCVSSSEGDLTLDL